MTQDEIIRSPIGREQLVTLAREAGAEFYAETLCVNGKDAHDFIERFAALVAAHEREKLKSTYEQMKFDARVEATEPFVNWREKTQKITTDYEIHLKASILAEREACAKVCDKVGAKHTERFGDLFKGETYADECAAAIRARGMDLLTQHSQAIGEYNDYPRSDS